MRLFKRNFPEKNYRAFAGVRVMFAWIILLMVTHALYVNYKHQLESIRTSYMVNHKGRSRIKEEDSTVETIPDRREDNITNDSSEGSLHISKVENPADHEEVEERHTPPNNATSTEETILDREDNSPITTITNSTNISLTSSSKKERILTGASLLPFFHGFSNQMFMLIGSVFLSNDIGIIYDADDTNKEEETYSMTNTSVIHYQSNQIYVHSLQWLDRFGTEKHLRHEVLFDVEHWNTYYPKLPKLVSEFDISGDNTNILGNDAQFTDVFISYEHHRVATKDEMDVRQGLAPIILWNNTGSPQQLFPGKTFTESTRSLVTATNPYPLALDKESSTTAGFSVYNKFLRQLYDDQTNMSELAKQDPATDYQVSYKQMVRMEQNKLISEGAFRPHPELQSIIDDFKALMLHDQEVSCTDGDCPQSASSSSASRYMVFHARIEPDMQKHYACVDKKVTNFTDIINSLYDTFPIAPAPKMIILLNKQMLESEVENVNKNNNHLAEHNLRVLNDVLENGLWDGQTQVIQAGSEFVIKSNHEIYSRYSTVVGGIVNYFLALDADIFVGTEISSYSTNVVNHRYYRHIENDGGSAGISIDGGRKASYFYGHGGLKSVDSLQHFLC